MSYEPRGDTLASRAIAYVDTLPKGSEIATGALCTQLETTTALLIRALDPAVRAGAIFRRQKGGHIRSPLFWSLVDHAKKETPQKGANRDASAGQSHGVDTSSSGVDRGHGMPAAGAAPAFLPDDETRPPRGWLALPGYTEGRDSQHVVKAEGVSPDATDRETPANASPSVGSMGAGQPADAGAPCDRVDVPERRRVRAGVPPLCAHKRSRFGHCADCEAEQLGCVEHFHRTTIDEAPVLGTKSASTNDKQAELLQRELAKPVVRVTLSIQCTQHQAERISAFVASMEVA